MTDLFSGTVSAYFAGLFRRSRLILNWQHTLRALQRLLIRTEQATDGANESVSAAAVLAPLADFAACLAALGFGVAPGRAQVLGFVLATALNLGWFARALPNFSPGRASIAAAVTVLAFVLRGGVFALLNGAWDWPAAAAIGCAVIATAAVMRTGYSYCAAG